MKRTTVRLICGVFILGIGIAMSNLWQGLCGFMIIMQALEMEAMERAKK